MGDTGFDPGMRLSEHGEERCPMCIHTLPGHCWCTGLCRRPILDPVAELDRLALRKAVLAPVPRMH